MRGSSDLKGGGSVRSRGDKLILVCVLNKKTVGEVSLRLVDAELSHQSIHCHPRWAVKLEVGLLGNYKLTWIYTRTLNFWASVFRGVDASSTPNPRIT